MKVRSGGKSVMGKRGRSKVIIAVVAPLLLLLVVIVVPIRPTAWGR